jgi:hypothetical protein
VMSQADRGAADQSSLRKLVLPGAVAAAGAGIAFLLTNKPTKRLRGLVSKLPGAADDLVGDLKERVQSAGGGDAPQPSQISQAQLDEYEKRRRERKKRRDRRQKRATT